LFVFGDSLAFGQSAVSVANEHYLTIISVAVAILATLTTIAILIPTIIAFVQIRRVEKEWERFTKMADAAEQRMTALRESVKEFRTPTEILKEAAEKAEKITESEVGALKSVISELEAYLKERLNKLEASAEKEKTSLDQLTTTVNSIKVELDQKPSSSDILVKVAEKYKIPDDLMEIVLQKVGLALFCLRNLTEEERKEILKVLSVSPRIVEGKEE
jgi:prefoldin subunit 5